jgi:hypothetical protein
MRNLKAVSLSDAIFDDLGRPASKVAAALGLDSSQVSRLRSNGAGLTLDKLDLAAEAVGYVPVQREYLKCVQYMSQVGTACACATSGMGACGQSGRGVA